MPTFGQNTTLRTELHPTRPEAMQDAAYTWSIRLLPSSGGVGAVVVDSVWLGSRSQCPWSHDHVALTLWHWFSQKRRITWQRRTSSSDPDVLWRMATNLKVDNCGIMSDCGVFSRLGANQLTITREPKKDCRSSPRTDDPSPISYTKWARNKEIRWENYVVNTNAAIRITPFRHLSQNDCEKSGNCFSEFIRHSCQHSVALFNM